MERIFYSIAEVSEMLCITQPTLRHWERQFKQLAPHRSNGRRFYTKQDIEVVKQIDYLRREEHLSIDAIKKRLSDNRSEVEKKQQAIERLRNIRNTLQSIKQSIS